VLKQSVFIPILMFQVNNPGDLIVLLSNDLRGGQTGMIYKTNKWQAKFNKVLFLMKFYF